MTNSQPLRTATERLAEPGTASLANLRQVTVLRSLTKDELHCLDGVQERHLTAHETLVKKGEITHKYWMLLTGALRVSVESVDGREETVHVHEAGSSFGEVPLLAGMPYTADIIATSSCDLLELDEDQFWNLMTQCPQVRKEILGNMALRLAKMQSFSFHQEKMASLGTMAAGLMHELNNPGAAARRASSQLRENLLRMHHLTAKFSKTNLTVEQKQWMFELQEQALRAKPGPVLSSLELADAEQALTEWMESNGIEDGWKLAPTLVSIGFDQGVLNCARCAFEAPVFSDALSWLEALVSSMQLVGTIEESIGRVTELVQAVKSYAYEGRGKKQTVDVNGSIHATLVILGHKLREKQIVLHKEFAPDLPTLQTQCQGLNQVWTNLIDNAIDAAPQAGHIAIKTWSETHDQTTETQDQATANHSKSVPGKPRTDLCILVSDNGSGIPLEDQPRIFDPFYTTKPIGVGTGLGLGIVYRLVEQYGGSIHFSSTPGNTEFVVRLPSEQS